MVFGNGKAKPQRAPMPVKAPTVAYEPEDQWKPDPYKGAHEPDLGALAKKIEQEPVRDIALLVNSLTFGEMLDLEATLKAAGPEIDQDLKPILHKWALEYLKKGEAK